MKWISVAALMFLATACASTGSQDTQADDEPDFSIPADTHVREGFIQSRADLLSLPPETTFITSGDHGSVELSSDDLEALSRFPRLQKLHLRHCRGIGNAGLDHIAKLKHLRELDLSGCVALTGRGIAKLAALRNLREILLNFCPKITRPEVEDLQRQLPRCDVVWSSDDPPLGAPPNHPAK